MATALPLPIPAPDEQVPASRIMRERSHWQDLAERNQARILDLVRENETLRIQRDDARQCHAVANRAVEQANQHSLERQIAMDRLRIELSEARRAHPVDRQEVEALRARVARMELREKKDAGTIGDLRDTLEDVLKNDAVGKDCDECSGTGLVADEEMVGDPGAWDGHTIRSISVECESCFSGRVSR